MKTRLLVLFFSLSFLAVSARSFQAAEKDSSDERTPWYRIARFGAGTFFSPGPGGKFFISFPYSYTPVNSQDAVPAWFEASRNYKSKKLLPALLNFSFETGRASGKARFPSDCFFAMDYSAYQKNHYLELRAGYNFPLRGKNKMHLFIRPSLALAYESTQWEMGSIDNFDRDIYVLGNKAAATFTYSKNHNDVLYFEAAQLLHLVLHQRVVLCVPAISLMSNPYEHRFNFGLSFSWLSPLYNHAAVELWQEGTQAHNSVTSKGLIRADTPDVYASLDGKKTSTVPFISAGALLLLQLGYSF